MFKHTELAWLKMVSNFLIVYIQNINFLSNNTLRLVFLDCQVRKTDSHPGNY